MPDDLNAAEVIADALARLDAAVNYTDAKDVLGTYLDPGMLENGRAGHMRDAYIVLEALGGDAKTFHVKRGADGEWTVPAVKGHEPPAEHEAGDEPGLAADPEVHEHDGVNVRDTTSVTPEDREAASAPGTSGTFRVDDEGRAIPDGELTDSEREADENATKSKKSVGDTAGGKGSKRPADKE